MPTAALSTLRPRRRTGWPAWIRVTALLSPALIVVAVFFVGGVGQALLQSLGYQPFLGRPQWSVAAYRALWTDPAVRASFGLTARVALLSTVGATVVGMAAALLLRRLGRGRRWVAAVFQANLAVPHLVGALCFLLLLSQAGLISRFTHAVGLTGAPSDFPVITGDAFGWGVIAEYLWKETPFMAMVTTAALGPGLAELEAAARTLGAGPVQRLRRITLPTLAPSVVAGSVLVLAFSAGSYEVPLVLGRSYPATLPVVAYQYFRDTDLTVRPVAMALAVVIAVLSAAVAAVYLAVAGRLSRRAL